MWLYVLTLRCRYMLKYNPSGRLLVRVKPTTPYVLSPISISVLSPRLSLSLLYFVFLCSTIGSLSLAHLLFAVLSLSQGAQRASHNGSNTAAALPAVRTGTAEMAVPMLCPAAAGYTWREEITAAEALDQMNQQTTALSARLYPTLSIKFTLIYTGQYGG